MIFQSKNTRLSTIVCSFLFAVSFGACNGHESSTQGTDSTAQATHDIAGSPSKLAALNLKRFAVVMPRLDSLKSVTFSLENYLARLDILNKKIAAIQTDTILPPLIRKQALKKASMQLEDLRNLAYIEKVASQCSRDGLTTDICDYNGGPYVPKDFVMQQAKPVGMLAWNENFGNYFNEPGDDKGEVRGKTIGSGCLISEDLYLTARHCLTPSLIYTLPPQKKYKDLSSAEAAPLMNVVFNYEKAAPNSNKLLDSMIFPVLSLVEAGITLDYAIIRLGKRAGKKPGEIFGYFKTVPANYINHTDSIAIIQHPEGKPKRVQCGILSGSDDLTLYYNNVDTYGGSSGAPVINYASGLLEGVHFDGNCYDQTGSNKAVKIQAIKKVSRFLNN